MITLQKIDGAPERSLTPEEELTVLFRESNATHYHYYQEGDDLPEIPVEVLPNWLGLEQAFVYSPLFITVATSPTRSDFWWGVINTTIQNGKRGEASQSYLYEALSHLGVQWTDKEKAQLNQLFTDNNFTIQI